MPVTDFSFRFLGTGTSSGIPSIACSCPACSSDDPRDRRTRSGACIQFRDEGGQNRTILIDTSPDLRLQAIDADLQRCDAILFTHHHVDHIFGLDEVRRFNAVMRQSIDVYAESRTLENLRRVFLHIFEPDGNVNKSFVARLIPNDLTPGETIDLFGVSFTPMRLLHGRLPVLGFRLDAEGVDACLPLAYCTDVSSFPPETWPLLGGLEVLVLDMLRPRHHPTHLTVDQACRIAEQVGATRTFFTHMSHDIVHGELDPELPTGMSLAWDGLTL